MLGLTRNHGEGVTITAPDGQTLRVVVLKVRGKQVGLGFQAPKDWKILRDELLPTEGKEMEFE